MELFRKLCLLVLVCLCFRPFSNSQDVNFAIQDLVQDIAENTDQELPEDWLEYMFELSDAPINLNEASKDDLQRIGFLSLYQIENLHHYIYQYGAMYSIYELLGVKGFDKQTVMWLSPFVTVHETQNLSYQKFTQKDTFFIKGETLIRTGRVLEPLRGIREDVFAGSPWQVLFKQKLALKRLKLGLTYEKDVGETFWSYKRQTPEFLSFYADYQGEGLVKQVVLGKFRANFGQGLTLWQNFGFGKSALVMNGVKTGAVFSRHSSASEYNYLNGAATQLAFKSYELSLFGSYRKQDASLDFNKKDGIVTSLNETGYHRTDSEIDRRNALGQKAIGVRIKKKFSDLNVAFNYHAFLFNYPLANDFEERGQNVFQASSLDIIYTAPNLLCWGELASDMHRGVAVLGGVNVYPAGILSFSLVGRSFNRDYTVIYSSPFSESGSAKNERGLYLGMEMLPFTGMKIQSYIDLYAFPGPRYNVMTASSGYELLNNFSYTVDRQTFLSLKIKYEQKEKNFDQGIIKKVLPYDIYSARFQLRSKLLSWITWHGRADFVSSSYNLYPEYGWMVMQDLKFNALQDRLKFDVRLAYFNTDSYQSRIYVYEPDVLYAFAIPVYFGKGFRYLINLKYACSDRLNIYAKMGQFVYSEQESISSGWTEIDGNVKTDFKLQIRLKF